ncbi:MAG: PAS domain S-box protein [Phenylobacterium sp.]|uniref:sensor histidine kinase n=1 Tax=Phenylobacterium sp. TaxID=1871053 RepID=UPI001207B773|nr:HWE histidine kinase domain-containing protein [Phenylobacterium sp.]TAL28500.1 MAG: PAS domain S-box protein [Phenylobacterium sp.]
MKAENARLAARVAELEAQMGRAPIDRASLYRMTDAAPWGALVMNAEGVLDYANPAFQRWLLKPAPAADEAAESVVHPPLMDALREPMAKALQGEQTIFELTLDDRAGEVRHLRLQVAPRAAGNMGVTGVVVSLYDLTDAQTLDRVARANREQLARVNSVTPSANYLFDFETGSSIWVGGNTEAVYGHTVEELIAGGGDLVRRLIHPDDFHHVGRRLAYLAQRPDGEVSEFELRVLRPDGTYRWILDRAVVFERNANGRIVKTLSAAIDIDERKRAEERRTLLINELNHRVKNTLAAVQSIARQTLRSERNPAEMSEIFTARLVSLSAAHDILTRENWEGAGMREIAQVGLAPFDETRITVSGPEVRVTARAAIALSMALHELATNATKYGGLSGDVGGVALTWRTRREDDRVLFELEWREFGGPPVAAPKRRGFGSRLLSQGVRADLNGVAELLFEPEGVICRITAPLETPPRPDQG